MEHPLSRSTPNAGPRTHRSPHTLWLSVRSWWLTKNLGATFWIFLGASFLFNLGMCTFFFLYNLYLVDRGFKESFLGLVTAAMAIGSIAGTIPAGLLAQRFGLRKTLLFCFALVSLVSALRALCTQQASLLGLAFLAGAALSIWAVSISPAIAQLTSEQDRPFAFSLVFSLGIGVGILGGQAGGRLPAWLTGMTSLVTSAQAKQAALLVACLISALALIPVARVRFTSASTREHHFYPSSPFLLRFLLAIAVWSLATGAFTPFFNVYFSQYLRMPIEKIGTVFSASQLLQVLAVVVAPVIFRRFGLVAGIMYMQCATAVALGCLAVSRAASGAALTYAGYTAFQWMSEPGMYSLLMNQVAPSQRSGASAMNFLVISLSQAIAAAAAGASFARFGYPPVLAATAVVALFAALAFRLLLRSAAS